MSREPAMPFEAKLGKSDRVHTPEDHTFALQPSSASPAFVLQAHRCPINALPGRLHPSSVRIALPSLVIGFCLVLAGCYGCGTKQDPQQLKEKTAQTTAQLKSDAKAVASGIREGWNRDKPLNINRASKEQLNTLPGITTAESDRIVANRPYDSVQELVTKRVLTQRDLDRIKDRITAN